MSIDMLAIGAHPDDVDMICGGTVAKMVAIGRKVVIVDLTRGETGSRGTPEGRAEEAQAAAKVLGVQERIGLDLGDGCMMDTLENRRVLIELIRKYRPKLVCTHYWDDLHPDHAAAGHLARAVMYPVGFANYPADGEPFRPHEVLFFMAHNSFDPSFIVDIDGYHEKKLEAVRCFLSQVHSGDSEEPPTGISQPGFLMKLESRARYFGAKIGRTFGEPFKAIRTVPVDDPVALYDNFAKLYSSGSWKGQDSAEGANS
jgi:N-acetylglucosamine malate deacetylase 1